MAPSRSARTVLVGAVVVAAVVGAGGLALLVGRGSGSAADDRGAAPSLSASPQPSAATPHEETSAPVPTEAPSAEPSWGATPAPPAPADGGNADGGTEVVVQVTTAEWDAAAGLARVNGFADVLEPDGTCTATFAQGPETRAVSRPATVDAITTSCGELTADRSVLHAGDWLVVLSFESAHSRGVSPPTEIEVP